MATGPPPPAYQDDTASNLPPAPPAYADEPPADGNATTSTQDNTNTAPGAMQKTWEAPADGEGILNEAPKRMLYIGVILLLYFILAGVMPEYLSDRAIDPCGSYVNNVLCVDADDATCEDAGEEACDAIYDDNAAREVYFESWALTVWAEDRTTRAAAWALVTLGMFVGLIGALIAAIFGFRKRGVACCVPTSGICLIIAGVLTFLGGFIFAVTFNGDILDILDASDTIDFFNAWRTAGVLEFLLPASIAVILGLDILKLLLNDEKLRMLIMTAPFAICGICLGVVYAMISLYEEGIFEFADLESLYGPVACMSSGYFIFGLVAAARIAIGMGWIKPSSDPASETMIQFLMALLLVIGAFICCAGYWALIDAAFDCDYNLTLGTTVCEGGAILSYIFPDAGELNWITEGDVAYEGRFKAYFVGYTFLVLGMSGIIAYDMDIVGNYKKVRMAQQAASAAA